MPAVGITGAVAPPLQAQALGTHPVCDLVFAWRRAVVPPDCGISAHRRTSSQARVSVPSRQPGGASRKLGPTGSEGSWRSFVTESNLILSRAHASTRRSVLEWSLRSGMLAQRRSGLICAKPVPSQIRPSAMPNRRCAAHLRSSALSGFLPVRPGSRAEGGAAIPGLDGQAAGLGACTLSAGGMTPISFSGGRRVVNGGSGRILRPAMGCRDSRKRGARSRARRPGPGI